MNILTRLFRIGDQVIINADGAAMYPELEVGDIGIITNINMTDLQLPYTVKIGSYLAYLDADTMNLRYAEVYFTHGREVRLTKRFRRTFPNIFPELKTAHILVREDSSPLSPTYEIYPHNISVAKIMIQPIFTDTEMNMLTFLSKNVPSQIK